MRVACIAPAWNEGTRITDVVRSIPRGDVETVLVVDDGSTDDTAEQALAAGAVVLSHSANLGVGAAIRTGIDYAIHQGYDAVVVVSGGGKTPGDQVTRLLKPILQDGLEFVQGSRYIDGGELIGAPLHRRIGTVAYTLLFSILAGRRVTDASSGFRAFRLDFLKDPQIDLNQKWLAGYELEPYLLFKALRAGHGYCEVPVTIAYPATRGRQKYTKMRKFVDWWNIFRPAVFLALRLKK